MLKLLTNVLLAFDSSITYPFGPTAGSLLDVESSVDVIFEQALESFEKMPQFANVLDLVAKRNGSLQFGGAPRTGEDALVIGGSGRGGGLVHFVFHTSGTERKGEFACLTVREHRMVQLTRGEHLTKPRETKLGFDVCVTWLRDELGMTQVLLTQVYREV